MEELTGGAAGAAGAVGANVGLSVDKSGRSNMICKDGFNPVASTQVREVEVLIVELEQK